MTPNLPPQHPTPLTRTNRGLSWLTDILLFLPPAGLFFWTHCLRAFNGYYGQDSHAYLAYSRKIGQFLAGGPIPGDFFWPVNYPLAGTAFDLMPFLGKLALPLLSLVSFLATIWLFRRVLIHCFSADRLIATLFTLCSLGISPALLRASNLAMSDCLAIFLVFFAWQQALRFYRTGAARCLLWAASLAGFAIGTRYANMVLLIFPGLLALKGLVHHRRWALLFPGVILVCTGLLPTWLLTGHFPGLTTYASSHHFSPIHWFQASFPNHVDGHLQYSQINLIHVAHIFLRPDYIWPVLPCLAFLGPGEFRHLEVKSSLIVAFTYLLFVAGLDMQNPRFLLPALPFLLVAVFPAWERAFAMVRKPAFKTVILLAMLSFSIAVFLRLMAPMLQRQALEAEIAADLKARSQNHVYTFAIDVALPTYGVNQPIINLWREPIDAFQVGGYAIFNETRFATQWHDRLPMTNWEKLKRNYQLKPLKDYGEGWVLFQIEAAKPGPG